MKIIICVTLALASSALAEVQLHPLSDEFIDYINSKQSTWKAGRNFYANTSLSYLNGLLGVRHNPVKSYRTILHHAAESVEIPESFDAREKWPECASIIGHIRDQGACGSCWAVAAAEAMSDRICIHSKGEKQVSVSAEDLMSCCYNCGDGCDGGYLDEAWYYWVHNGIVTGGDYGTTAGCQAYEIAPCAHHIESSKREKCGDEAFTPACSRQCDVGTSLDYQNELTFGETLYGPGPAEDEIKADILTNGPVETSYTVYEDFYAYKSGVYQHVAGERSGEHAVKILGWGVEDDTPYWLIANSWNSDWGDNGYFKIIRGSDHLGIESEVVTGMPKL